jgi:glycosyltransferase involved in cell wall biosynthesis
MSRYSLDPSRAINPRVRELLDGDLVQMLVYGEKVSCDVLILRHPSILQEFQQFVPDVEAANVHVIVNQTPRRAYGHQVELEYTISRCAQHLQRYFGKAGIWHPISPAVRETLYQHHAKELTEITLASEDWSNIIDVNEWRRESRPPRGPRVRIGRHSRDAYLKWPGDRSELLAIYPDSDDYEVYVLGGANVPREVLGGLPENWHVLNFGAVHPKDFLETLDVFVYYTHPTYVEAFGRTMIEAMAVGVPVILPRSLRKQFEEAAIYAEPSEVKRSIDRLMGDDDYYESQVKVARDYVEKHFGYTKHAARLREQIEMPAVLAGTNNSAVVGRGYPT